MDKTTIFRSTFNTDVRCLICDELIFSHTIRVDNYCSQTRSKIPTTSSRA